MIFKLISKQITPVTLSIGFAEVLCNNVIYGRKRAKFYL